jgi:hypothetical protein
MALGAPLAARAAEPYASRPLTLPRLNAAFDPALGIGHTSANGGETGPGLNLEGAVGLTSDLELGFRTGARMGGEARHLQANAQADAYGRLFDTETFGTGGDALANPELRVLGRVLNAEVVEIGLEGRIVLPFEGGTHFGAAFGAPFLFHFGRMVRLDTGAYLVTIFDHNMYGELRIPARLWFQATHRLWLGPILALHHEFRTVPDDTALALGFGLGYQITSWLDFKTQFLFPAINRSGGNNTFGLGAGVQIRIE